MPRANETPPTRGGRFGSFQTNGEKETGAGDESRARDLNLGKVALYQLSYSRVAWDTSVKPDVRDSSIFMERETSLELATSTLARLRSTN